MPFDAQHPLVIWRLLDGKPGHEKQTLGLANALAGLVPTRRHDIAVASRWDELFHWLGAHFPAGAALPAPDLILAAGHATHIAALAVRRARGGKTVVLMRPSLPLSLFDLCLIPEHDSPPTRANVIATQGVLNDVRPGKAHDPAQGLFLVGGPSAHYDWDDRRAAEQIQAVARAAPDTVWQLTTSRRTPDSFLACLDADLPRNVTLMPHAATPPGWLERQLAQAATVWVTEDSVSMLYEALTAGARVGLIEVPSKGASWVPSKGASRVGAGVRGLIAAGWVTNFSTWRDSQTLPPPPARFQEAERCARLILARWFPQ